MENITADGKIKTIRCVKATHEDFAKLVNLGKEAKKELEILVEKWGNIEHIKEMTQKDACHVIDQKENKTVLDIYIEMTKKAEQLYAYHNAYHVLMEEGVDELLMTIGISPDGYGYDFYELCINN